MATIRITIPENPNEKATQIKVTGAKGAACESLTRNLEQALGTVQSDERTDEFFEQPLDQAERQYQ